MLRALLPVALLALSVPASAADYTVDTGHSQVGFTVSHLVVSTVRGQFSTFEGSVSTNGKGLLTGFSGTVDVGSVDTRDAKRDGHLKSADFFDAATHPKMSFASRSVEGDNTRGYTVKGDLTIRGVTRPVTFAVEPVKGPVTDPWGNVKAGTVATTTINRQDFGVSWSQTLDAGGAVVGDDVTIQLELELLAK